MRKERDVATLVVACFILHGCRSEVSATGERSIPTVHSTAAPGGARSSAECSPKAAPATPTQNAEPEVAQSVDEKLKMAREIREVVQQFLRSSPEQARSHLPSDFAAKLPLEVGTAEVDFNGGIRIGVWSLDLQAYHAQLDYYPDWSIDARHRFSFRIKLARKNGRWELLPPGVSFVHTWMKDH